MASVFIRLRLPVDMNAVRSGNTEALAVAVADFASVLCLRAGFSIAAPLRALDIAAEGDTAKAGMLAAAVDLRDLLSKSPAGRKALNDLGFQPLLEHIEGE